jgi:hypothetical protein
MLDLVLFVRVRPDDHTPIQEIHRDSMRCDQPTLTLRLRTPDHAVASVGSEHDVGRHGGFQRPVQERETLHIEHMNLVDEQDTGDELGDALFNVPIDDLVNLSPELVGDLRPSTLDELSHDAHDILTSLRPSVGHVQVVQSDILNNLLAFVYVPLGQRDILLGLQIILGSICITPPDPLDRARIGLDINHVPNDHAFLLQALVNGRIESELFGSLGGLESDNDVGDGLAIPTQRVFRFSRGELGDFPLVDFLGFLYPKACGGGGASRQTHFLRISLASILEITFQTPHSPIALLNPPLSTSVFFTSPLKTSLPTIGQKGTLAPSS